MQSEHSHEYDFERKLSKIAEGTPSFEEVRITDLNPLNSYIKIRSHYFKDTDHQAVQTLKNFSKEHQESIAILSHSETYK